ncbi:NEDD8-activating enzyme E1 regulatory subunit [Plasmodiophora brassicae]
MEHTHHEHKFDRQIRLWGYHGQAALESAHVLVLGSGPIASEFVKNLIIANVGGFTIVDGATTSEGDSGNNFFVEPAQIGHPRAEATAFLLSELNPDRNIQAVVRDPVAWINACAGNPVGPERQCLKQAKLVLASQLPLAAAARLCDVMFPMKIPLMFVRGFGLIGYLRIAIEEHAIMESHSESDRTDLFIHQDQIGSGTFPELASFLSGFDLTTSDPHALSHIPFPAILYQLGRQWVQSHGTLPRSASEIAQFKALISSHDRLNSANFEEALRYYHYATRDPSLRIDSRVTGVLRDPRADDSNLSPQTEPFWILVNALNRFVSGEGRGFLPVSPSLPDMTADTQTYVALKALYQGKAERDRDAVLRHVHDRLDSLKMSHDTIPDALVELFVRNCRTLDVCRMRSLGCDLGPAIDDVARAVVCEALDEEQQARDDVSSSMASDEMEGEDPPALPPNDIHWYIAIKCADVFLSRHGRYPGDANDIGGDVKETESIARDIFKSIGVPADRINVDTLEELTRFGSSAMHNTSAFMGGLAAQEALKVLTQQYVPFNNTCIWNGVHATLARWSL